MTRHTLLSWNSRRFRETVHEMEREDAQRSYPYGKVFLPMELQARRSFSRHNRNRIPEWKPKLRFRDVFNNVPGKNRVQATFPGAPAPTRAKWYRISTLGYRKTSPISKFWYTVTLLRSCDAILARSKELLPGTCISKGLREREREREREEKREKKRWDESPVDEHHDSCLETAMSAILPFTPERFFSSRIFTRA